MEAFIDIGVTKDSLIKAVAAVESNVHVMNEGVTELASLTHNRFVSSEATVDTVMGVVQSLKSRVGDPVDVEEQFMAPTLWGTISMVVDEAVDMRTCFDRLANEVGPMKTELTGFTDQIAKLSHDGDEVRKTVALVVGMVGGLVEKAQEMRTTIIDLKQQVAAKKGDDGTCTSRGPAVLDEVLGWIGRRQASEEEEAANTKDFKSDPEYLQLIADVKSLKASITDGQAIKFAELGLRDVRDTVKWVEKEIPNLRYGLFMDPLLMFERIYGDDEEDSGTFLKSMETRLKLKIETG